MSFVGGRNFGSWSFIVRLELSKVRGKRWGKIGVCQFQENVAFKLLEVALVITANKTYFHKNNRPFVFIVLFKIIRALMLVQCLFYFWVNFYCASYILCTYTFFFH